MSKKLPKPRHPKLRYPAHARELPDPRERKKERSIGGIHIRGEQLERTPDGGFIGVPDGTLTNL